ncbi:acetyl-CoA synthetase [Sulfodiicoccus acidiphilus]|uniref:Acetyl-CoA synthetase n=1 Tax=Sulfodiicoccus acidiphilus TaxID=1670455 RepID=A0A348B4S2_9CREN|nr:acyl--CoA ligase [Sulfodiicoccus acidiphilus]BBD73174.1 acetyl-CoA synthetase [Sulfodiicoccus acidiphilus]GGU01304.1 acetyl-CoA synthetase [Sulfodiicoccus acidiphilus]
MDYASAVRQFADLSKSRDEVKASRLPGLLTSLNRIKQSRFNWAAEVFEGIHVRERGSTPALIWTNLDSGEEGKLTYSQLSTLADSVLSFLRKEGVKAGDSVYLMTPLVPEQWASMLAIVKGGMVGVPTAVNLTTRELSYRFSDLRPAAVIADQDSAARVEEAMGSMKPVKLVIGRREGWTSTDFLPKETVRPEDTSPHQQSLNYFTSGTTGLPKRVIHTASSYPVGSLSTAAFIGLKPGDLHLNLSAPGWAKFAWSSFFSPFNLGATVLAINYSGKLDASKYLNAAESLGVTTFCAPPTAWRQFVVQDLSNLKFDKLREAVSAGEPLNPEVIKVWRDRFEVTIRDFYGQTETTAMIGNLPWEEVTPGSMGRPSPMYDVVLLDDEGREIRSPGTVGHVAVKLSTWRPVGLFLGYSDDSKNRDAFRGGYYYTGDRAYFDERERWFFVGRSDDVIKTSDYRVGPFEVESAVIEHPAVAEVAVVGSPDPQRWQLVKAFVVLKPGYRASEELAREIASHCREVLMAYKVPRIVEFVDELPKTTSGKIRRNELRKLEEERRRRGERGEREYFV